MSSQPPHARRSVRIERVRGPGADPDSGPGTAALADAADSVRIRRVLGDHPLAEVGIPRSVAADQQRGMIAVGGHAGSLSRPGAAVTAPAWTPHRVGVYERDSLRCRLLVHSPFPVNSLDFHPTQPLLAVGTGAYDGGFSFYGELLLVHLDSGEVVSALGESREVRNVAWRSWRHGRVLDLALAPYSDNELGRDAFVAGFDAAVERGDWLAVGPQSIGRRELDGPHRPNARTETDEAVLKTVTRWCAAAGAPWERRRAVWAVEPLPGGRVLATLDGVRLEAWHPDGTREWSTGAAPDEGGGRQIEVTPDGASAWVTVPGAADQLIREGGDVPWSFVRHAVDDGRVLDRFEPEFPGVFTTRADGWTAVRDITHRADGEGPVVLFRPDASHAAGIVEAGRVDLGAFSHLFDGFPVRRATALYFLVGDGGPPNPGSAFRVHGASRVVEVVPDADGGPLVRRLFLFDPRSPFDTRINTRSAQGSRGVSPSAIGGATVTATAPVTGSGDPQWAGAVAGGPSAELADASGRSLVCSGSDNPLNDPESFFIARRSLPDGATTWLLAGLPAATALDTDDTGTTVFAALVAGEGLPGTLIALDAATGRVLWRLPLHVDGWPTTATSLACAAPDRLLVGTACGRILDLTLGPRTA